MIKMKNVDAKKLFKTLGKNGYFLYCVGIST